MRIFDDMWARVDSSKDDSDSTYFGDLLLFAEYLVKVSALALISAVDEDTQRSRYRQLHRVVRANSLGEWTAVIDELVSGPTAQRLIPEARDDLVALTKREGSATWQHDAIDAIASVLKGLGEPVDPIPDRVAGVRWFHLVAQLRNATRGHGAFRATVYSGVCRELELSVSCAASNLPCTRHEWAHLRRNLSGKYRVTPLTQTTDAFEQFKIRRDLTVDDGVYISYGGTHRPVPAVYVTPSDDIYVPNGGFTDATFEALSYVTGSKLPVASDPFLAPATPLRPSETAAMRELAVLGNCHTNIPTAPSTYVSRPSAEPDLQSALMDDRHAIVTLAGSGGIGKTWMTLAVLNTIALTGRFDVILWFSSRDIDLTVEGPKSVRPDILSRLDIARTLTALIQSPDDVADRKFPHEANMAELLQDPNRLGPCLFVFDNFETVQNPVELYTWIDTYVRNRNKVLITTRVSGFRGDFVVHLNGMDDNESHQLIERESLSLGISQLIDAPYEERIVRESSGHPYAIKVILGHVATEGQKVSINRIAASDDQILDALFERTYSHLSPAGKRCFLTLANWHSTIPSLALESVLLRPENERINVQEAIDELVRHSFVESSISASDGQQFLSLPLYAHLFGRRKLVSDPLKLLVQADTEILQLFGASQPTDIPEGLRPRVERLFRNVAQQVGDDHERLQRYLPMLELVASKFSPAWLLLSDLYEQMGNGALRAQAIDAARRYIESTGGAGQEVAPAWERLVYLYKATHNLVSEVHALVEWCEASGTQLETVSQAANRANEVFKDLPLDSDQKRALVLRIVEMLERHLASLTATDCSRLAWLYSNLQDEPMARDRTALGLRKDPDNEFCRRLANRLGVIVE